MSDAVDAGRIIRRYGWDAVGESVGESVGEFVGERDRLPVAERYRDSHRDSHPHPHANADREQWREFRGQLLTTS